MPSPKKRNLKINSTPFAGGTGNLRLTLYVRIHNLFATYLNLNCFFVSAGDPSNWNPLFYSRDSLNSLTHFEILFGKYQERNRYNELNFERLRRERKTFLAKHRGFYDLFTPVVSEGTFLGFLAAGSFVREPFTEAGIIRQWSSLSGRRADGPNLDFVDYARMALGTVVLSDLVLGGLKEVLEMLADFICGRADSGTAARLEELRSGCISQNLPHGTWMDFMLGSNQFHPRVTAGREPNWWEREELGITRYPTTVFAVAQRTPALEGWSTLNSMVGAARLQLEALKVAREFPETVAGRLEDYGALFVTSASPSKGRVQAKLEIRDRVEALRRRLEKRTGLKLAAGVGATLAPGAKLAESRLQAVLAMNLSASTGRSVVFFEEDAEMIQEGRGRGLRPALSWLRKAYRSGSPKEREAARGEFIRQALLYSHERQEIFRAHLLEACYMLTDALGENAIEPAQVNGLADSMEERLLTATTLQDMLSCFKDGLDRIGIIGDKPAEGRRLARMEEVKKYVDRNFSRAIRLTDLAEQTGLSEPAFLKGFRRATGQGFSRYLQGMRLEESKRLLRNSSLSIDRVARESGFNSSSYFVQSFKRSTGLTPGSFRSQYRPGPGRN